MLFIEIYCHRFLFNLLLIFITCYYYFSLYVTITFHHMLRLLFIIYYHYFTSDCRKGILVWYHCHLMLLGVSRLLSCYRGIINRMTISSIIDTVWIFAEGYYRTKSNVQFFSISISIVEFSILIISAICNCSILHGI